MKQFYGSDHASCHKKYWNYSKSYLFLQFYQLSKERLCPFRTEGKWVLALLITTPNGPLVGDEELEKMEGRRKDDKPKIKATVIYELAKFAFSNLHFLLPSYRLEMI